MNREEFMKLNPCIAKAISGEKVVSDDLLAQGKFLANHTFIFERLRPREVSILKMRLGLLDGRVYRQKEIATILDLSPARIQQLERKGLLRLANSENIDLLMKYDDSTVDNRIIKQMIKNFDHKKLMIEDIEQALHEGEVVVNKNINILDFYIPSAFRSSIKQKLISKNIKTIKELVYCLKTLNNLKVFKIGDVTYTAVIFGIGRLIERGVLSITDEDILESYYRNKNSYFEYLTVNNFTDPVVFPEVEKIEEEKPKDENQSKNRRIAIMQAKKVFGEDLSVVPIDVLNFGLRVYNALRRGKVDAIEQLINYYYDYNGFLNIRWISNFGEAEVLDKMKDMGIELKTETFSR